MCRRSGSKQLNFASKHACAAGVVANSLKLLNDDKKKMIHNYLLLYCMAGQDTTGCFQVKRTKEQLWPIPLVTRKDKKNAELWNILKFYRLIMATDEKRLMNVHTESIHRH